MAKAIMPNIGRGNNPSSYIKIPRVSVNCRKCKEHLMKVEMHIVKTICSPEYYLCNECYKKYINKYRKEELQCYKCKTSKPIHQLVNCNYKYPNNHKHKCKGECNDN